MSIISLRRLAVSSSCVALLSLFSSSALAQEEAPPPPARHFGDTGTFALSLNHNLLVNMTDLYSGDEVQGSIFLAPGLSLGLAVGAQWLSGSPVNSTSASEKDFIFHVGPRLGYDLRISNFVSFWPQVGVDYRRIDSSFTPSGGPGGTTTSPTESSTSNAFGVTVLAPILIHPTHGFFVGAGPALYAELSNSTSSDNPPPLSGSTSTDNNKVTSVGLMATIGGAF